MEMIGKRIADTRILRLILKWLNAGIIEDGIWSETKSGTPDHRRSTRVSLVLDKGCIASSPLAHAVIGFQHEYEAKKYLENLGEQLGQYGLELNEEKTRLIRFGRFAQQNRDERGEGKTESFTLLGFQHICAENRLGRFEVRRITDGDRRRKKLQAIKQEIRQRMHDPVALIGGYLRSVLNGYFQYHAVPGNLTVLSRFRRQVARYWFRALGQRSQRRPAWDKPGKLFDQWLPVPKVVHEYPDARFDASRRAAANPR